MRVLFVETSQAEFFSPLAWTRPVFELLCGTRSVRQRVLENLQPESWGAIVRPHLQEIYQQEHPEAHINDAEWIDQDDTLIINGLWVGNPLLLLDISIPETPVVERNQPIALLRRGQQGILKDLAGLQTLLSFDETETPSRLHLPGAEGGLLLQYPWDLIRHNGDAIKLDFELLQLTASALPRIETMPAGVSNPSNPHWIAIHPTAQLEQYVSINAEQGPVIVEEGVQIQSFTRLEGPCFIGRDTQLFRANIRGETSIGPVCRVGGEIEASIIHGYANKYHDGFLGHSYVCPWVNLGALTTNSDLKNDYSQVKMAVGTHYINTGQKKVGSFIGDHAKTAIGTLFNTGSNIGVMTQILPAGRLCPKHIPSFSRYWQGELDEQIDFAHLCTTAKTAMDRRNQEFTPAHERLFENIRTLTQAERTQALERG